VVAARSTPEQSGDLLRSGALRRVVFATHRYERTTVRAPGAGVDPSMVIRCYGSKDDLFRAATAIDRALPDLLQVPVTDRGTAAARHRARGGGGGDDGAGHRRDPHALSCHVRAGCVVREDVTTGGPGSRGGRP
jgi:hypothetical protein